jgi:hypothetical protein
MVVAVARGMSRDSAARVKLFVSTIRMNVRIAVILSITIQTPVGVKGFFACAALVRLCACGVGLSLIWILWPFLDLLLVY